MSSIELIATPNELCDFLDEVRNQLNLTASVVAFEQANKIALVSGKSSFGKVLFTENLRRKVDEVWFSEHQPEMDGKTVHELRRNNHNVISVTVPIVESDFIGETIIGLVAQENKSLKAIWSRIRKQLKERTKQGMWVVDRVGKRSQFYRNHMYTEEIAKLFEDGIRLISVEGFEMTVISPSFN